MEEFFMINMDLNEELLEGDQNEGPDQYDNKNFLN